MWVFDVDVKIAVEGRETASPSSVGWDASGLSCIASSTKSPLKKSPREDYL